MPAHKWTSPAQCDFLFSWLPAYLEAKANTKKVSLSRFWTRLNTAYFDLFKEELQVGVPLRVPGAAPLTAEQSVILGKGINKTKERLKGWMRYREAKSQEPQGAAGARSLFRLLTIKKVKTCPYRLIETYQKMFPPKIQDELDAQGNCDLNEEFETEHAPLSSYMITTAVVPADGVAPEADATAGVEVRLMTEEEITAEEQRREDLIVVCVRKNRRRRFSMHRRVTVALFDAKSDEVKGLVKEETARRNRERAAGNAEAADDGERTPEQYQHICTGKTPLGLDFQASHPEFVLNTNFEHIGLLGYLAAHDIRDSRALPVPGSVEAANDGADTTLNGATLDGMITLEDDIPKPTIVPVKSTAPKRMHHKAPAPSASASREDATPAAPTLLAPVLPGLPPSPAPGSGPVLHLPQDFDQVMENIDFSYDDDSVSSTFGFTPGFASDEDEDNPTLPFAHAFAPNFSSTPEDSMEEVESPTLTVAQASTSCPAPHPIHQGAGFQQNRVLGGSLGNKGSFLPPNDYRPSVLLQALVRPHPSLWSSPFPPHHDLPTTSPPVRDCSAAFTAFALTAPIPSSLRPGLACTRRFRPTLHLSSLPGVPPVRTAASSIVVPSSLPSSSSASASASLSSPASNASPPAAPATPTITTAVSHFSNGPPGAAARPSALSVFKETVANVTADAEQRRVPPAPYVLQYIQSRPAANIPAGHPLAPATQKAAARQAAADLKAAKPVTAPARCAPATMSAAARTETRCVNREAAVLRRRSAALRKVEKLCDDKAAAEEKAAERLRASRENPTGGVPLFVTSARPKRALNAGKNADRTPILRPKKRGTDVMAEEDAWIEAAFAAQKADEAAAVGEKGARAGKKTAVVTAPRAEARAGTRAAAAKPAANDDLGSGGGIGWREGGAVPMPRGRVERHQRRGVVRRELRGTNGGREAVALGGGKRGQRRHEKPPENAKTQGNTLFLTEGGGRELVQGERQWEKYPFWAAGGPAQPLRLQKRHPASGQARTFEVLGGKMGELVQALRVWWRRHGDRAGTARLAASVKHEIRRSSGPLAQLGSAGVLYGRACRGAERFVLVGRRSRPGGRDTGRERGRAGASSPKPK
ncbi:hypothetical protein DFH06DRAFT_1151182 [Mycena polygramma]|nr:hypothetical protein DFH06DRAFT_1151182 [Mycena polygramma]